MMNKKSQWRIWLMVALLLAGLFLVACASTDDTDPSADDSTMENMDHESMNEDEMENMNHDEMDTDHEDMEDMDHEHLDEHNRIPNEGDATITILAPEEGATFSTLDQVLVEVAIENFELGVDGSHWHVYVDDVSFGMVMGGNTDQALPGLEPGEHEVSVYLALGTHEEYADGDSVTIIVEE